MIHQVILALAFVLLCGTAAQNSNGILNGGEEKMKCYRNDDKSQPIWCVPEFVNAAFHRNVESNNTCGTPRSRYCVQTLSTGQEKRCDYCDSNVKALSHPSVYITDIKDDKNYSWWQSDTLYRLAQNGVYNRNSRLARVSLTLDLGKTFEVVSIRLRFRSLRPESMAIFKRTTSNPNEKWIPYQYYSRSCQNTYGVEPDGIITRNNLQSPLCTAKYSQLVPIFGGEVLFRTLGNRPGRDEIEKLKPLQDWIRAYSLRFHLDKLNTFGDDIFEDANVLRSYYYAIIDLTVVGKCDCNGHASKCEPRDSVSGERQDTLLTCVCEHFTDGMDCEKCLPFYNNKPWAKATSTNANPCEVCDCNNLADVCEFDPDLYLLDERRGGRCVGCRENTGGPFCEICRGDYHRKNKDETCKPCNCNPVGSVVAQCAVDGRCYCKDGVTGEKCDRCRPDWYGFSKDGCSLCECSRLGTRHDSFQCDENGQCTCKRNVVGKNCDKCLPGYFALEKDNQYGCRQCFCYGHSSDCKSAGGFTGVNLTTVFRLGLEEWKALNSKGEDRTRQFAIWDQSKQNVRVTSINQDSIYLSASPTYLGEKRSSYSRVLSFTFKVADTANMEFTPKDIIFVSNDGLTISTSLTAQGNPVPTRSFQRYKYRLHEDPSFDWMPHLNAFKFQRLLDDVAQLKIRMTYSDQGTGFIDDISLEYAQSAHNSVDFVSWVEQCTCPPPYVGLSCQECRDGHKHETVNGSSYDRCVRCECNNHAEKCDPDTGNCVCEDNTAGENCGSCKPGFYGNPTSGTKDDCKPCPCVFGNQCIRIGVKVKCTDCPDGHRGDLCDQCIDGYYGDPSGSHGAKTGCVKCDCNGNIDNNAVLNCDSETGDCLKCIYNSRNGPQKQCELCKNGFYGDARSPQKPGCKACACHENGTFVSSNTDSSQPLPCNNQGECICRPNVDGKKCDKCKDEYWNINSKDGCEACNCNKVGSLNNKCDMNTGQCVCKPGVGGRMCDQCLPDHYKFSNDGCKACNCSGEGSLGVSCNEDGKCVCRPGVLGIKCDQCGENRFNLSAGCTRCPPCFDALKEKVDKLRAFIKSLNGTGSPQVSPDKDFQEVLNKLREQLLILLNKAQATSVNDKELMMRLDALNLTMVIIEEDLNDADRQAMDSEIHSGSAAITNKLSDDSIKRSWELVKKLRELSSETAKIIQGIYNSKKNWSVSTIVLKETAREVRNLSKGQWEEVNNLQDMANKALGNSQEAGENTKKASKIQNDTMDQVTIIDNGLDDLRYLGKMALNNATQSKKISGETLKEANDLLEKGQIPLEGVDVNKTKAVARETTAEAIDLQEKAKRLANQPTDGVNVSRGGLDRKKDILYTVENRTDDLLRQAKEANKTAHDAIVNGTKTLKDARESLKTLENFNALVSKGKNDADKAKELIPEIKRLIASANNKTDRAHREIGNAEDDVEQAIGDAENALKTSTDTSEKAESLKERAGNLAIPDDSVYNETIEAESKLSGYEKQAEKNKQVVKNATKTANETSETAKNVMETIKNTGFKIVELASNLADLPLFDYKKLEKLENVTAIHVEVNAALQNKIDIIKKKETFIDESIAKYTLDLSELEKAVASLARNQEILPKECLKDVIDPN